MADEAKLPDSCVPYQPDYQSGAWREYSLFELGMWVHLFTKRAAHRSRAEKRAKDLRDAQNYLDMMQVQVQAQIDAQ